MRPHYKQLTDDDRLVIESLLADGLSLRAVAARVGVHASTVCRERQRGLLPGFDRYLSVIGQRSRQAGRSRAGLARRKLGTDARSSYWPLVLPYLRQGWSPQQIAGRLRDMPASPSISHETIYAAIYAMPRGGLRTELVSLLRKSHAGRLPRARGSARFTGVQNMTPIGMRPPEVDSRRAPGHWEADLLKGARNASAVGTLIERTSRYVMLAKLDGCDARSALDGFTRRLRSVPASLRKTLTYDQGTEMALHQTLAKRLKIDIFFCDPHSPWQRASNENANGLIREYLPKGMDLSTITQPQLKAIELRLNTRPRKILDFQTPEEVFSNLKLNEFLSVALQA
jgi:transposase, IS30 family